MSEMGFIATLSLFQAAWILATASSFLASISICLDPKLLQLAASSDGLTLYGADMLRDFTVGEVTHVVSHVSEWRTEPTRPAILLHSGSVSDSRPTWLTQHPHITHWLGGRGFEFAGSGSSRQYLVFTCYQATLVLTSTHVPELDILWHAAEQRNALPDQHRYARDCDVVDLAGSQELLDRDPAIDIDVFSAGCRELVGDLRRITALLLNTPCGSGKVEWTMA